MFIDIKRRNEINELYNGNLKYVLSIYNACFGSDMQSITLNLNKLTFLFLKFSDMALHLQNQSKLFRLFFFHAWDCPWDNATKYINYTHM